MIEYPPTWAADGPTAGPSGEHIAIQALWERDCTPRVRGVEHVLSQYELNCSRASGISYAADPDLQVFVPPSACGGAGPETTFAANVKGVLHLRDSPLSFTSPRSSVRGAVQWAVSHNAWCVLMCVAWGGQDIRIATPLAVMAQGDDRFGYWWFDASSMPTLDQWLRDMPPYVGGALARPVPPPVAPPNVIYLPRAA